MKEEESILLSKDYVSSSVKEITLKINKPLKKGNYVLTISGEEGKFGEARFSVYQEFGGIAAVKRIDVDNTVFLPIIIRNSADDEVNVELEVWPPEEAKSQAPLKTITLRVKPGLTPVVIELNKEEYGTLNLPLEVKLNSKERLLEPDEDGRKRSIGPPTLSQSEVEGLNEQKIKKARLAGLFGADRAGTY